MEFKDRLIYAMDQKKVRQIDLSNRTGLAPGTISNYMQGKYEPKGLNLEKIARELDVNVAWLAGYNAPIERDHGDVLKLDFNKKMEPWEEEYYEQDLPFAERDEEVTREELNLLTAYRDADPAIQAAVRKLLDVENTL